LKISCNFPEFIEPFCGGGVSKSKLKEIIFSPPLKRFGGSLEGIEAAADFYGFLTPNTSPSIKSFWWFPESLWNHSAATA
jgi:hypothetical protein